MGTTFRLQKIYSRDEESHLGRNLAIAGGTLAAAGGAFYGARKGMLGNRMAMRANTLWGKAGVKFGNEGMVASAAKDYGRAAGKHRFNEHLSVNGLTGDALAEAQKNGTFKGQMNVNGKMTKTDISQKNLMTQESENFINRIGKDSDMNLENVTTKYRESLNKSSAAAE